MNDSKTKSLEKPDSGLSSKFGTSFSFPKSLKNFIQEIPADKADAYLPDENWISYIPASAIEVPREKEGYSTENKTEHPLVRSLVEAGIIKGWKIVEDMSARLLEIGEDYVILECLVNRDEGHYEEREFKKSYFKDYLLEEGKLFKLTFLERKNQVMMEVKDNPNLVSQNDFPQIDFVQRYSHIKFSK